MGFSQPAVAEGTGPFGYPNLLVNHDFDDAVVTGGDRARFKSGNALLVGWTGYGEAGVSTPADTSIWLPLFSNRADDYRVFIQMQNGWADDTAYIELVMQLEKQPNERWKNCRMKNGKTAEWALTALGGM